MGFSRRVLLIAIPAGALLQIVLLLVPQVPLGIPGEWTWSRTPTGTTNPISLLLTALLLTAVACIRDFNPEQSIAALGGLMLRDGMGDLLKIFILLISGIVLIYAKHSLRTFKLFVGEFYLLLLFAVLGMFLLVSSDNLIMLYLGLELLALSSYALVALDRDSPVASESAMKYFVLGAIASGMLGWEISSSK